MVRHESALTWAGWAFDEPETKAAALKDKLDAEPDGAVNGPEGFDWGAVDWRRTEVEVDGVHVLTPGLADLQAREVKIVN